MTAGKVVGGGSGCAVVEGVGCGWGGGGGGGNVVVSSLRQLSNKSFFLFLKRFVYWEPIRSQHR